ncbi:hypothetical protein PHLCEN_2v11653 [Hermanssonia centrifuga]|uniref:Uncharacterized protein n=1 Tax=Hermanssonia centrifuga TaxID=98765 RepID=A0A2R6NJE2_9APHY|nr:hypothetical protein PHLCEN_2v11653 [Hermanssonia centrifuga]
MNWREKVIGGNSSSPSLHSSSFLSLLAASTTTNTASDLSRASTATPAGRVIGSNASPSMLSNLLITLKLTATSRRDTTLAKDTKCTTTDTTQLVNKKTRKRLTKKKSTPAMKDVPLPNICNNRAIWRGQVISSYIHFVASLENPWNTNSTGEEIDILQQSWSTWFLKHKEIGTPTQNYVKVILKLNKKQWRGILKAGMKHVKQSKTLAKTQEVGGEEEDNRILMIVDRNDEGYSGNSE